MDTEAFLQYFAAYNTFNIKAIKAYFMQLEPSITQTAIHWRIHSLIEKGLMVRTGRGAFSLGSGKNYMPVLEKDIKKLYRKLRTQFPRLLFCIWNTKQFNEFMIHQPGTFYTLIETEPDSAEYVFHFLQRLYSEVFWNPSAEITDKYVSVAKNAIVVKDLVSEAPVQLIDATPTISLEKLLVDVFCDSNLYVAQQGMELETIFRTATEKYTINTNKLLRYASRRNRKNDIADFLNYLTTNNYRND